MATARKRWFRVADGILRKGWSNDDLAMVIRLAAYLNNRWASDRIPHAEAGVAAVHITDLMVITGKRRADVARTSAGRLADLTSTSVEHRGDVTLIDWTKFAEFQDYGSRSPSSDVPLRRGSRRGRNRGAVSSVPEEFTEAELTAIHVQLAESGFSRDQVVVEASQFLSVMAERLGGDGRPVVTDDWVGACSRALLKRRKGPHRIEDGRRRGLGPQRDGRSIA